MSADPHIELARLRAATERVGATLLAVDSDPTVLLLDAASRRGVTAERWEAARTVLASVFERYRALGDALERAASLSSNRLGAFVAGPSIAIVGPDLELVERGLLDGSRRVTSATPDELLAGMTTDFDGVRAVVADVAAVWAAAVPRVAVARTRAAELAAIARAEGMDGPAVDLDDIAALVVDDPLAVSTRRLDAVDAALDVVAARIDAVIGLRNDTASSLAAARDELDVVAARVADVRTPGAAAPADVAALRAELAEVGDLAAAGVWAAAADRLTAWREQLTAVVAWADAIVAAARRDELVGEELLGRLRAYAVKAERHDLLEAAGVADCRRDALAALARGDIPAASERVATYQALVNAGAQRNRGQA